jgi:hypothetical protein
MGKFHCEHSPPLGRGPKIGRITKHVCQRNIGMDRLGFTRLGFHSCDLSMTRVKLSQDIA